MFVYYLVIIFYIPYSWLYIFQSIDHYYPILSFDSQESPVTMVIIIPIW
jgi:hypothetical protein